MIHVRPLITLVCAAEIAGMAAYAGFVAQLPLLSAAWDLTASHAGWVSGAFYAGYGLAVPIRVTRTDRTDPLRVYLPSMLATAAGALGFALLVDRFWSALLFQVIMGAGLAGTYMPGLRLLTDRLEGAAQSRAVALYTSSYRLGAWCARRTSGLAARRSPRRRSAALMNLSLSSTTRRGRMMDDLPSAAVEHLDLPSWGKLQPARASAHPPRILLLYGSLRERSYSRLLTLEAERLLNHLGAETRVFDPRGLPQPDTVPPSHSKVAELRDLSMWSEGQVWCSPERHGTITGIFKSQIDWLPLEVGGIRPTQGRTLAVMQVSGGSQSFNTVNALRVLGRWMRMVTIPNQSSVPKAFQEFDDEGRMKPSPLYDRVVDVMEELVKFTLLVRDRSDYLTDRYSERKIDGPRDASTDLSAIAISHETSAERPVGLPDVKNTD